MHSSLDEQSLELGSVLSAMHEMSTTMASVAGYAVQAVTTLTSKLERLRT